MTRKPVAAWCLATLLLGPMAVGCGDSSGIKTVKVGVSLTLSGVIGTQDFLNTINVAFDQINEAGGIRGVPLELLVLDTKSDIAGYDVPLVKQLIKPKDVVAVLGPDIEQLLPQVFGAAKQHEKVMLTGRILGTEHRTHDDGGFVIRTSGNEHEWTDRMVADLLATDPPTKEVMVMYGFPPISLALRASFIEKFTAAGGSIVAEHGEGFFPEPLLSWGKVVDANPKALVYINGYNGLADIVRAWDDDGRLPGLKIYISCMARDSTVLTNRPKKLIGMIGHSPSHSLLGGHWEHFAAAYRNHELTKGMDPYQASPWMGNFYDAAYLLALGLIKQSVDYPEEMLGGAHLRDIIKGMSSGPAFGPATFTGAVEAILSGSNIDYEGASGAYDFDERGDVIHQPQESFKVGGDDLVGRFEIVQHFE